jgi:hypothetical protein
MSRASRARHLMRAANPLDVLDFADFIEGSESAQLLQSIVADSPLDAGDTGEGVEPITIVSGSLPGRVRPRWVAPVLAAAVLVALVIGTTVAVRSTIGRDAASAPSPSGPSAATLAKLWQIVQLQAAANGDPQVSTAQAVLTTDDAVPLSFKNVGISRMPGTPARSVWAIQIQGTFSCSICGGAPPGITREKVIALMVDAESFALRSLTYPNQAENLSTYGPVVTLRPVPPIPVISVPSGGYAVVSFTDGETHTLVQSRLDVIATLTRIGGVRDCRAWNLSPASQGGLSETLHLLVAATDAQSWALAINGATGIVADIGPQSAFTITPKASFGTPPLPVSCAEFLPGATTVKPTAAASAPTELLTITLLAKHGRGIVVVGSGPVAGNVTVTDSAGKPVAQLQATTIGGTVELTPGNYTFSATIKDGVCTPAHVTVGSQTHEVTLACQDGASTD